MKARRAARALALLALLAGCGSSAGPKAPPGVAQSDFERQLADAARARPGDFPAAGGRSLQAIADTTRSGTQLGLATSVLVPGTNRLAFGVLDKDNAFVYGKSAVYIAPSPGDRARGPYPAPADSLVTKGRYRSRTAASEDSAIAAIYAARVPFPRPGRYSVLVMTKQGSRTLGAPTEVQVRADSPIPAVGERPPAPETDTVASAGGDLESIDTRVPPAPQLHEKSLKDVLGRRPVALLFATPQLCQSRVCGPVVDIELQLSREYGDRMVFIHQEVYENNKVEQGLRAPLRAFKLRTEPWLFTFDKSGRVAARLEGSFGIKAFRKAIEAALR